MKNGKPVAAAVRIPITFAMDDTEDAKVRDPGPAGHRRYPQRECRPPAPAAADRRRRWTGAGVLAGRERGLPDAAALRGTGPGGR
ncbi:hypothetical protein G6F63_016067 [Rhizopus arrhizus]|uniref:Uncharacterized protein n=1 Tax=Rhizopus delemar TaxID=936053 RepID=A0A9P7BZQ6_9FUNG|nr:hypothetical protein G6F63_016067 [Rhizopus arrhizus]KAG1529653.1 hypothetical protein G6F50_017856 [Rhizopus delemar]